MLHIINAKNALATHVIAKLFTYHLEKHIDTAYLQLTSIKDFYCKSSKNTLLIINPNHFNILSFNKHCKTICYNTEFIETIPKTQLLGLATQIKKYDLYLDISETNLKWFKKTFDLDGIHLPLGYSEFMDYSSKEKNKNINAIFIGSINERRGNFLKKLDILPVTGLWNLEELFKFLAKTRILVNIHFNRDGFELVRLVQALSNKVLCLSEKNEELEKLLKGIVIFEENLEEALKKYLNNPDLINITEKSYNLFKEKLPLEKIIKTILLPLVEK